MSQVALSRDGTRLAVAVAAREKTDRPAVHVYDTETGRLKSNLALGAAEAGASVLDVRLNADGGRVLLRGQLITDDGRHFFLRAADTTGAGFVPVGEGEAGITHVTEFADDGKTIAYTTVNGVRFYDAEAGTSSELRR